MKEVKSNEIYEKVKEIILKSVVRISDDVKAVLLDAYEKENSETAKFALEIILKNCDVAKQKNRPLCQDTGMAMFFIEIGQEVIVDGEYIEDTLNRAVKDAYSQGNFRQSVLDPITRKNTGDNTPAIIHYEIVKGDKLKIAFMAKGFGSENMTKTYMLTPNKGVEGIVDCVLDCVKSGGSSPCPPLVVGIGIGGTLDKAAALSKKALLRKIRERSKNKQIAEIEETLLKKINALGIGALGYGGNNTALDVNIETYPTHIAGLPVCVSLQCHSVRHGECIL